MSKRWDSRVEAGTRRVVGCVVGLIVGLLVAAVAGPLWIGFEDPLTLVIGGSALGMAVVGALYPAPFLVLGRLVLSLVGADG